jgi:iron complex outermembrane recepter protein
MRGCRTMIWNGVNSAGRKQRSHKRLLMTTSLATLMTVNLAYAQQAPTIELNPIVINSGDDATGPGNGYLANSTLTGTKTSTPLREVPRSVSIITREQLDDRPSQRIEDALAYTAGVTSSPWGVDERYNQFMIRGFDVGPYAVSRDGLPQRTIDFSGFKAEPYGLERIEVIKGAASVLYGQNGADGLVNLTTKRPTKDALYSAYAGYGSHNTYEVGLDAGGPLDKEGVWTYRLTGLFREGHEAIDFSKNNRVFIAPAITWSPSADTSLTVFANYQWDKLPPNTFLPVASPLHPNLPKFSRSFTTSDPDFDRFNANHGSIGYSFEHRFNDAWTVRQNLRYTSQDTDYRHLYYTQMLDEQTLGRAAFTVDETATIFSVDNSAQYDYQSDHIKNTLLMGLDYNRYTVDGHNGYAPGPGLNFENPVYGIDVPMPGTIVDRKTTTDQVGIYAQTQTKINDRWLLNLGGRQSWFEEKTDDRLSNTRTDTSDNAFTGNVGLGYLFDNGITPYASYSTSFVTNIGQDALTGSPYAPSKARQYEIGVKYDPDFMPAHFTAALFDITKTNVLAFVSDGAYRQIEEVRHRGFEFESTVDLFHNVSLTGSYTYLDAEITASSLPEVGNRTPMVPKNQASLWAKYTFDSGLLQGLNIGSGIRYVGSSVGSGASGKQVNVPDYTLVDAAVSYEKNGWKGALKVSNLFDKGYYSTCSTDYDNAPMCIYGEGRTIKGTLSVKF